MSFRILSRVFHVEHYDDASRSPQGIELAIMFHVKRRTRHSAPTSKIAKFIRRDFSFKQRRHWARRLRDFEATLEITQSKVLQIFCPACDYLDIRQIPRRLAEEHRLPLMGFHQRNVALRPQDRDWNPGKPAPEPTSTMRRGPSGKLCPKKQATRNSAAGRLPRRIRIRVRFSLAFQRSSSS